jgi:hypothetical protein
MPTAENRIRRGWVAVSTGRGNTVVANLAIVTVIMIVL